MNPKSLPTLIERDASFSTHLRLDQLTKCEHHNTIRPGQFTALDHHSTPELGIFNAHKYFSEVNNNSSSSSNRVSPLLNMNTEHKHNPQQGRDTTKTSRSTSNNRARSFHAAAPTASPSDASSRSQACFVSHPPTSKVSVSTMRKRNPPHRHNSTNLFTKFRASVSKAIRLLRNKCPCSCEKFVRVSKTTPKPLPPITTPPLPQPQPQPQPPISLNPKTPTAITNKLERDPATSNEAVNAQNFQPPIGKVGRPITEGFTFPALPATSLSKNQVLHVVLEEEPPRYSLEVFQPTVDRDHRRNSPSPPTPKSRAMDDDAASDASSDLFEIESFSTQATSITCPIVIPKKSECHEPSDDSSVDLSFAGEVKSSTVSSPEGVAAAAERDRLGATTGTAVIV